MHNIMLVMKSGHIKWMIISGVFTDCYDYDYILSILHCPIALYSYNNTDLSLINDIASFQLHRLRWFQCILWL